MRKGQLLVCIKPFQGLTTSGIKIPHMRFPQVDHVYTFDGYGVDGYYYLKEFDIICFSGRAGFDTEKLIPLSAYSQGLTEEITEKILREEVIHANG